MAFDGITMAALVKELDNKITDGRISKIAQPEADELILTIHTGEGNLKLLISADASLPLAYLTENNKQGPLTAPNFCMLLRKHIQGGRIVSVTQPGLERIMITEIEHLDEMGDLCRKKLIFELMGKHSNIIFTDSEGKIIDSIKRISFAISSVREVLPGRDYVLPPSQDKEELLDFCDGSAIEKGTSAGDVLEALNPAKPAFKAIYGGLKGISPLMANEICFRAGADPDMPLSELSGAVKDALRENLMGLAGAIKRGEYSPCIVYENKLPAEYSAIGLTMYGSGADIRPVASISALLEQFYREKNISVRIRQRSADLRHLVQVALERNVKKLDLQMKQLKDTEDRDKNRLYGELLTAYAYQIDNGCDFAEVDNYYTGEKIRIPMDKNLSPSENAKRYFDKYGKQKRTFEHLTDLIEEAKADIEHLRSIQTALDIALAEEDLVQIRLELEEGGYVKKSSSKGKKAKITSKPFHYISSDGYDIYVGKNNFQNDELTFKFANGGDWWFHAKKIPGSHVVLKVKQGEEVPDRAFEEAAKLAAFYSSGREYDKVEIDYVRKKEVKKPSGAKPGFVVYYTNYSMTTDTDISSLRQFEQ
ncbi:MAG: NFACT family protein [Lachnospiraceae bacterium]|nr:NFACT family protein [Lachnospiraceae bacterium]MBR1650382.1 NFACT family protein [Lachnospiraceae bacterium]